MVFRNQARNAWERIRKIEASTLGFSSLLLCGAGAGVFFDRPAYAIGGMAPLLIDVAIDVRESGRERRNLETGVDKMNHAVEALSHDMELLQQAVGITVATGSEDTYKYGVRTVVEAKHAGGWTSVRLFAPVGLLNASETKREWLETIGKELGSSIGTLFVVAGLPTSDLFDSATWSILGGFADTPGTHIRYIPPSRNGDVPPIQGMGMAIFENEHLHRYRVIYAFAGADTGRGENSVGRWYSIDGELIGRQMADWFDHKIWACYPRYVLRGSDPDKPMKPVDLAEKLQKISVRHYGGRKISLEG